jgi:hypothetical protein
LGIGDWGLGIGPIPNPQSPIPNPHIRFFLIAVVLKQISEFFVFISVLKFEGKLIRDFVFIVE